MSTTHHPVRPPGRTAPRHDIPVAAPTRTGDADAAPVALPVTVSLAAVLGSTLVGLQHGAPRTVGAPTTPRRRVAMGRAR
ncbi:hypothetical protein DT076_06425 [Desertihabitans brevis]|uniref:Uncharacterized protein n=1 Tax=Desertihabitans brevis TaxID=2268447 RepID=A0A367YXP0_9ACTN|nr:hypothetical protein DT076_06425 [Desertihabitans brevis]